MTCGAPLTGSTNAPTRFPHPTCRGAESRSFSGSARVGAGSRSPSQDAETAHRGKELGQIRGLHSLEGYKARTQMALTMTRPTKHPKTGTFLVRVAIPAPLREMTQRLFGVRAEIAGEPQDERPC